MGGGGGRAEPEAGNIYIIYIYIYTHTYTKMIKHASVGSFCLVGKACNFPWNSVFICLRGDGVHEKKRCHRILMSLFRNDVSSFPYSPGQLVTLTATHWDASGAGVFVSTWQTVVLGVPVVTYLKGTVLNKNHWESYQADFYVEVGGLPARAAEGLRIPVWSTVRCHSEILGMSY